jgi:hypothetical protein
MPSPRNCARAVNVVYLPPGICRGLQRLDALKRAVHVEQLTLRLVQLSAQRLSDARRRLLRSCSWPRCYLQLSAGGSHSSTKLLTKVLFFVYGPE